MGNQANRISNTTNEMDNKGQRIGILKIAVLGDTYVGKTCLVRRYKTGKFEENVKAINGWGFCFKQLKVMEMNIQLYIRVVTGQQRFRGYVPIRAKNALGILLLYDITDIETFKTLGEWLKTLRKIAPEAIIFIIGARADLSHQREVDFTEGHNFAKEENLEFFECSAKTGENVNEIFEHMTFRILQKQELMPLNPTVDKTEIEGKSLLYREDKPNLNATCFTEEEILRGSSTEADIFDPKVKDTSYPEGDNSLSSTEIENMIGIKEDDIGSQSRITLKSSELNENYHPSSEEKDGIPKEEKFVLSEDERLLEGKCPAWFA